jgi:hypothetical protein
MYRLPEDGGMLPKHETESKRLHCCEVRCVYVGFINKNFRHNVWNASRYNAIDLHTQNGLRRTY